MAAAISIPCKFSPVPCIGAPFRRIYRNNLGLSTSPKYPGKKKQQQQQQQQRRVYCEVLQEQCAVSRRELCFKGAEIICYAGWIYSIGLQDAQAKEAQVGAYLPPAPSNAAFVQFKATKKDTPALRAGNVEPYQFLLPPTWKQVRVANILSGNYCQPKCAEPWVEVKFEDETQGIAQVVASPLIRLTNKPNARIEDIGSPEKLIASLGPFVTGNSYDPDELIESHVQKLDGQTYYSYTLETPYARTGTHNLAKATAKGNTVVLFVVSASDKQWSDSEKILRTVVDSFEV